MKEKEIRPKKLFKKFLNLTAQDVKNFLKVKIPKFFCFLI